MKYDEIVGLHQANICSIEPSHATEAEVLLNANL